MERKFIARPYAKAIFDLAMETNSLDEWDKALMILEDFSRDPSVITLYDNPTIDNDELITLLHEILGNKVNEHQRNFIQLLINNGRLKSLKTISKIYTELLNEHRNVRNIEVITSKEISEKVKDQLINKLREKLNIETIKLDCRVDESIVGGMIIKLDNHVIDGSVKNKIIQLKEYLIN